MNEFFEPRTNCYRRPGTGLISARTSAAFANWRCRQLGIQKPGLGWQLEAAGCKAPIWRAVVAHCQQ